MKIHYYKIAVLVLGVVLLGSTTAVSAAEFDPNYLISDNEMSDYGSMDLSDIQSFLSNRSGTLKSYLTVDKEGAMKTAPQSFFEIAQRWTINPKYLLVLVQKEQSLLEDAAPTQGQYDRATGYGCPDSGGCDDRWKGFYKQVNSAAAQTRYYLDNINEFSYRPSVPAQIDDQIVTPKNAATAGLYNYTPHIHGNLNFWNLWNKYFGKKWPDGSVLQEEDGSQVFLISDGKKREFVSKAVMLSRIDPKKIVMASANDLSSYETGVPIKYLNFSLLKDSAGTIYMIFDEQKRKIASPEVFKNLGFQEEEVTPVSDADLALYENGSDITTYTVYPAGALLQDIKTKKIYYVLSGRKKLVTNKEVQNANFQGLTVKKATPDELDQYMEGNPVTLPDGSLIKVKKVNTVYVVANGQRLPIFSGDIFEKMNYNWKNVVTVSQETLDLHPLGQTITGEW